MAVLSDAQVNAALRAWKQKRKKPVAAAAAAAATGQQFSDKELDTARDDLRKSGRTFASVEQLEASLEDHLRVIGPEGRRLQASMFPGIKPLATGGFGTEVTIRPPRNKDQERVAQLLKHISQLVFAALQGPTQEIEALYVNGVLVIAGNHRKATTTFLELAGAATAGAGIQAPPSMLKQLVDMALLSDQRRVDERLSTAAGKMAGVVEGHRTGGPTRPAAAAAAAAAAPAPAPAAAGGGDGDGADVDGLGGFAGLAALVTNAHVPAKVFTAAEARAAIETGTPQVLLMHDANIHAEQQLVRLLVQSSVADQAATIRGTKRPCFGCYLALEYARRFQGATALSHGARPGGYWLNSCQSALEFLLEHPGTQSKDHAAAWVLAEAKKVETAGVNRTRELTARTRRDTPGAPTRSRDTRLGDADADTDSDSDADLDVLSPPMRALVGALAIKPPPKRRPRAGAAAAAAAAPRGSDTGSTGDDDDTDTDDAAPASAPASASRSARRPKRRDRDDSSEDEMDHDAAPRPARSSVRAAAAAASAAIRLNADGDSGSDADTEDDTDGSRHVDKRQRRKSPPRTKRPGE